MYEKPIANAQLHTATKPTSRLFFVDNLRTSLITLVLLHHVAVVYGGIVVPFYYFEPPFTDPLAFL
ncbi:hypothetical protein ACFLU4_04325, partial [Chloroflexota bacterium]